MIEPDEPKPAPAAALPRKLDDLSVDALESYIAELQAEMDRVLLTIADRIKARGQADSIFKP